MIRRLTTAVLALCAIGIMAGSALAHEGHDHKVMGTLTMAAADHVMVKATDGKDVTIQITKDTKVLKDKQAIKVQDIAIGTRVAITAVMEKDVMKAKQILVGAAPKTAAK